MGPGRRSLQWELKNFILNTGLQPSLLRVLRKIPRAVPRGGSSHSASPRAGKRGQWKRRMAALARQIGDAMLVGKDTKPLVEAIMAFSRREVTGR